MDSIGVWSGESVLGARARQLFVRLVHQNERQHLLPVQLEMAKQDSLIGLMLRHANWFSREYRLGRESALKSALSTFGNRGLISNLLARPALVMEIA